MFQQRKKPDNVYKSSSSGGSKIFLLFLLFVVIIGLMIFSGYEYETLENDKELMIEEKAQFKIKLKRYNDMVDQLEEKIKIVEKERDEAKQEVENNPRRGNGSEKELENSLDLVSGQFEELKKQLQNRAKIDLLDKFGTDPIRVQIDIAFHPDEIPEGTADSFVIEMAPTDLVPYTVNFFLQQVNRGLYDGCSFHRNAGHVVQGGPTSNHLSQDRNVRKPFQEAGYTSVAFQEYHKDFPHKKYTLGYAGRPGGPDFYVSVRDNTRNHGPGGQTSYKVKSEADPCFAKVVEGFEAVDRMHTLSVQPGDYNRLVHYVAIKKMTILGPS